MTKMPEQKEGTHTALPGRNMDWDLENDMLSRKGDLLTAEVKRLRGVLEGIAKHGLRSDLNPTRCLPWPMSKEVQASENWWQEYMTDAGTRLRDLARAALQHKEAGK